MGIGSVRLMLNRRVRGRNISFRTYSKPLPRIQRLILFLLACLMIMAAAFLVVMIQFIPIMQKLAAAKVTDVVMYSINAVIDDEISKGTFDYNQIVSFEKDDDGTISALVTNMALVNRLQSGISMKIVDAVENQIVTDMRIPIGNAVGGVLFSGRGPSIPVKVLSVANAQTKFSHEFSEAGINQTRHKIMIDISVDIDMFIPGTKPTQTNVTTQVEVCETIIVGRVPNVYADFGNES